MPREDSSVLHMLPKSLKRQQLAPNWYYRRRNYQDTALKALRGANGYTRKKWKRASVCPSVRPVVQNGNQATESMPLLDFSVANSPLKAPGDDNDEFLTFHTHMLEAILAHYDDEPDDGFVPLLRLYAQQRQELLEQQFKQEYSKRVAQQAWNWASSNLSIRSPFSTPTAATASPKLPLASSYTAVIAQHLQLKAEASSHSTPLWLQDLARMTRQRLQHQPELSGDESERLAYQTQVQLYQRLLNDIERLA